MDTDMCRKCGKSQCLGASPFVDLCYSCALGLPFTSESATSPPDHWLLRVRMAALELAQARRRLRIAQDHYAEAICSARDNGAKVSMIARAANLTRQRVHQILGRRYQDGRQGA